MTDEQALYDDGLQAERTLLAWRRTCLSFAVASLIAARYSMHLLGMFSVVIGFVGAGLAAAAYFAAAEGYRRAHRSLHASNTSGTSGIPIVLAAAASLCAGIGCALFIALDAGA